MFFPSYNNEMTRIDTCASLACVMKFLALRNWANKYRIGSSVGLYTSAIYTNSSVPILDTGSKYPTPIFGAYNFAEKSVFERCFHKLHISIHGEIR